MAMFAGSYPHTALLGQLSLTRRTADRELRTARRRSAREDGVFCCPASAAALHHGAAPFGAQALGMV